MGLHDLVGAARREVEVLVCLACLVAIVSPGLLALDCALASLRRRRANAILILGEEAITLRLRLRERPALALARAVALACDEGEAGDEMRAMGSYTSAGQQGEGAAGMAHLGPRPAMARPPRAFLSRVS